MTTSLAARIDAKATRLIERVVAEMYENPFWASRFGARGRRHSEDDGRFHLSYLTEALVSGDPGVMTRYARWLQSLLVSRGMCTRHLDENFERLERAVSDEEPDAAPAVALLRAARISLRYDGGVARTLQDLGEELSRRVTDAVYAKHSEWDHAPLARARCRDDVGYHIAYLADALAATRVELFQSYVTWVRDFLTDHRVPGEHLVEVLRELDAQIEATATVPDEFRSTTHHVLRAAIETIA